MSEAIQNWPDGVTPMPGSPSWLRASPVPVAAGRGAPWVHVVPLVVAARASVVDSGATRSSVAPAARARRAPHERIDMTGTSEQLGRFLPVLRNPEALRY